MELWMSDDFVSGMISCASRSFVHFSSHFTIRSSIKRCPLQKQDRKNSIWDLFFNYMQYPPTQYHTLVAIRRKLPDVKSQAIQLHIGSFMKSSNHQHRHVSSLYVWCSVVNERWLIDCNTIPTRFIRCDEDSLWILVKHKCHCRKKVIEIWIRGKKAIKSIIHTASKEYRKQIYFEERLRINWMDNL